MTNSPKSKGQQHVPTDDEGKVVKAAEVENRAGHAPDKSRGIMDILLADEPKIDNMMIPPRSEYSEDAEDDQRNLRGRHKATPPKQPSRNIKEALLARPPEINDLPLPPRNSHPHIAEGFDSD